MTLVTESPYRRLPLHAERAACVACSLFSRARTARLPCRSQECNSGNRSTLCAAMIAAAPDKSVRSPKTPVATGRPTALSSARSSAISMAASDRMPASGYLNTALGRTGSIAPARPPEDISWLAGSGSAWWLCSTGISPNARGGQIGCRLKGVVGKAPASGSGRLR